MLRTALLACTVCHASAFTSPVPSRIPLLRGAAASPSSPQRGRAPLAAGIDMQQKGAAQLLRSGRVRGGERGLKFGDKFSAGRSSFAPLQAGIGDLGDGDDSDLFGSTSTDEDSGTQVVGSLYDGTPVLLSEATHLYRVDVSDILESGTETRRSTLITTIKVIVGGLAPLLVPWAIKMDGLIGGPIIVVSSGLVCTYTVRLILEYKDAVVAETGWDERDDLTYVDIATYAFGPAGTFTVLFMIFANSLGLFAAYLNFIGPSMALITSDPSSVLSTLGVPALSSEEWQTIAAAFVVPLNFFSSNARFLTVVAYCGALGVLAAIVSTCVYGFSVTPDFFAAASHLKLFTSIPEMVDSLGVVIFLFSCHFAIFPIERNMKTRTGFADLVYQATWVVIAVETLFGILGYCFFAEETKLVVLDNVQSGVTSELVRLFLVFDMVMSAPILLSAGREIVESWLQRVLSPSAEEKEGSKQEKGGPSRLGGGGGTGAVAMADLDFTQKLAVRTALVGASLAIAQSGNIETITKLLGGVAQTSLAFIIPPALSIFAFRKWSSPMDAAGTGDQPAEVIMSPGSAQPAGASDYPSFGIVDVLPQVGIMLFGIWAGATTILGNI